MIKRISVTLVGTAILWFVYSSLVSNNAGLGENQQTPYSAITQHKLSQNFQKQTEKQLVMQGLKQQPEGAGEYFAAKRFNAESTNTSNNYVNAIIAKRKFLSSQRSFAAQPWQNLGPEHVGGRTRSLVFHPDNSDIIYAGGVSGGVWKSADGGISWGPVSDDLENMAVVTLAIQPNAANTLFAGTGEGVYIGRPIVRSRGVEGNGIYRSTDAGETWQALSFTLNNPDFRFVNKIRATQDASLFAATEKGVWRSLDNGDSWQLQLDRSDTVGGCLEIEINPSLQPNSLLVSCGSFETAAVYKSNDNGETWQTVLAAQYQGRTTLAYAPSNSNRVYALSAQNQFGPSPYGLNGLYRSDDAGDNWILMADSNSTDLNSRVLLSSTDYVFDCYNSGQYQASRLAGGGWYYNLLTVDPTNEDRVWAGGLDLWRSDDGGSHFGLASFWWAEETQPSYIHGDHHLMVYHPDYDGVDETRVFATNDGGLWQTTNPNQATATNNCAAASSQINWQSLNNNYAVTQFYHGSVSRDGQTLIGGSQDNGTQWRSATGIWQRINGGDGSYSAIDPTDSKLVYVSSQYANLARIRLNDSGNQVTDIASGIDAPGLFITPFMLDPNQSTRLWLAGIALWRSDNQGDTWVKSSREEYNMNYIDGLSALAVQPNNSNLVLVGGSDGNIYRHTSGLSGNAGSVMQKIKVSNGYISSINFDANNPAKVVASVSTFGELHAWLSEDAGVNWVALDDPGTDGLPDLPAHDILIAPHDTNTLYVATDIGVYVSQNNGQNWLPLTTGLPNIPVEKLVYSRFDLTSHLFAFTYGRGVFKTHLESIENFAPQVNSSSIQLTFEQNSQQSFSIADNFHDSNGDQLVFTTSNLPSGLILSSNGFISGSVTTPITSTVAVIVTDGEFETSVELTITVTKAEQSSSSGGGSLYFGFLASLLLLIFRRAHLRTETTRIKPMD